MTRALSVVALLGALLLLATPSRADEPATQPAPGASKVAVLPFDGIGDVNHQDWIGKAIQSSVVTELSRSKNLQPTAIDASGPFDGAKALAAAQGASASVVVYGNFQVIDNQLRITGQILKADSGEVLGGLKASGGVRDLFNLEDTISAQALKTLAPALADAGTPAAPGGIDMMPPVQAAPASPYVSPPDTATAMNNNPDYSGASIRYNYGSPYDYGYPYYSGYGYYTPSYGYPWYDYSADGGTSIIIINSGGHRHGDRDGDHDRDHGKGGNNGGQQTITVPPHPYYPPARYQPLSPRNGTGTTTPPSHPVTNEPPRATPQPPRQVAPPAENPRPVSPPVHYAPMNPQGTGDQTGANNGASNGAAPGAPSNSGARGAH